MKEWKYAAFLAVAAVGICFGLWAIGPSAETQSLPQKSQTVMFKCLNDGGVTVCQDSNGSLFRLVPTK